MAAPPVSTPKIVYPFKYFFRPVTDVPQIAPAIPPVHPPAPLHASK